MITNPIFSSIFYNNDDKPNQNHQISNVYNIYRIFIAVFFSGNFMLALRTSNQNLWVWINLVPTFGYLLFSIIIILAYYYRPRDWLLMLGFTFDVLALTCMLYFSGSVDLQIILLFLVTVAGAFMLLTTKRAILLTLFAIAMVMYQQFFLSLKSGLNLAMLSNVSLMSMSFISVAYLSYSLSKRVKEMELLSQHQADEVYALNAINEKVVGIINEGVVVVSHDLEIMIANDTAVQQLQLPQQLPNYFLPDLVPSLAEVLSPVIGQINVEPIFYRSQTIDQLDNDYSTFNDFRIHLSPLNDYHTLLLIKDLREEQAHAQQLKLASLGQLTASIAHEIRNPLSTISQASQMLLEESNQPDSRLLPEDAELYDMIFKQTKRVNQLIEDVLKLSRQQKPNQVLIEPHLWLPEFINEHYGSQDIQLKCHSQDGLLFDRYQLEQVLINLINNGLRFSGKVQAIPCVILEVHSVGKFIHIDVMDSGEGVKADNLQNLFNPFFTTDNQGTGLGLYLSQAFCQANHASLNYVLNHQFTCFRISCYRQNKPMSV